MKKITIAIDGFSSCGKSTMAKELAKRIGYIYIDSGAMYRVVTLYALRNGMFNESGINEDELKSCMQDICISFTLDPHTNKPLACLNGEVVEDEIRLMDVSRRVSMIAALPFVREDLTRQQQLMGKDKGIVMDGRDIGTTVFPDAELKIFVTASADVRAKRRYDELLSKGESDVDYDDILRNVKERDFIDQNREVSPLRKADDAILLDNGNLTHDEQNAWLMKCFNDTINGL
jgi:cytidylate kinase